MLDEKPKRDFKGIWIPKELWLAEDLTLQEKVFLAEIDSLDQDEGCYASNRYFAKFFGLSMKRVSFIINSLCQKGLVVSAIDKKAVNKDRRRLYLQDRKGPSPKTGRPYPRKRGDPLPGNEETLSPNTGRQDNNKDNIGEKKEDNRKDFSQTRLSEADAKTRGYLLLVQHGVSQKVARAIVYEKLTPLESIEEAIKNGLARQKYEEGFVLKPGYIVAVLNGARKEGKTVTPTKKSNKLKQEINRLAKARTQKPLSQQEFGRKKKRDLKKLLAAS